MNTIIPFCIHVSQNHQHFIYFPTLSNILPNKKKTTKQQKKEKNMKLHTLTQSIKLWLSSPMCAFFSYLLPTSTTQQHCFYIDIGPLGLLYLWERAMDWHFGIGWRWHRNNILAPKNKIYKYNKIHCLIPSNIYWFYCFLI